MKTPPFPIVLRSPGQNGFTFFRRINADLTLEQKTLGAEWEPHDPPNLVMPLDKYLYHMVYRVKWTLQLSEGVEAEFVIGQKSYSGTSLPHAAGRGVKTE